MVGKQKLFVFLSLSGSIALGAGAGPQLSNEGRDEHLMGVACEKQIIGVLDGWEKKRSWTRANDASDGTVIHRSPTKNLGTWLETRVYRGRYAEVSRITPQYSIRVTWKTKGCVSDRKTINVASTVPESQFTDDYLAEILKNNGSGVIYAWSPHMPFSLKAIAELKKALERLKMKLILALDPNADAAAAASEASANGLEQEALRRMGSVELRNRGLGTQFPSALVFSAGKITGPIISGARSEAEFETSIKDRLNPRPLVEESDDDDETPSKKAE